MKMSGDAVAAAAAAATGAFEPEPYEVPDYYTNLDNFDVERKIGRGQFSVVYRARCLVDNTVVALKKVQVRTRRRQRGGEGRKHLMTLLSAWEWKWDEKERRKKQD